MHDKGISLERRLPQSCQDEIDRLWEDKFCALTRENIFGHTREGKANPGYVEINDSCDPDTIMLTAKAIVDEYALCYYWATQCPQQHICYHDISPTTMVEAIRAQIADHYATQLIENGLTIGDTIKTIGNTVSSYIAMRSTISGTIENIPPPKNTAASREDMLNLIRAAATSGRQILTKHAQRQC